MNTHEDEKKSNKILAQQLGHIRELLGKLELVVSLVYDQREQKREILETLARQEVLTELKSRLLQLHPADIAYILENLAPEERAIVWQQIRTSRAGDVLLELSEAVREHIMHELSSERLEAILKHLDADDLAYLADEIPPDILEHALKDLTESERQFFDTSVTFSEDSVGHLMTHTFVSVRETDTLAAVLEKLRGMEDYPSHLDKLFVLDMRGVFRGLLSIQALLRNATDKLVEDVMSREAVVFSPADHARDATLAFERYDLISAPVVNERGKPIGRLTVDDVMDYQRNKANEEMLAIAGLSKQEDLFQTIRKGIRNRRFWIILNVFTALIASRVIGLFETTIAEIVALAALMPIVASIGGNTGNQTMALMIRALAMGQLDKQSLPLMIRKELGINLVNGFILGAGVGLFAYLFYSNLQLSLVIGAAMLLNQLVATSVGLFIPLSLHRSGRDPALGSTIMLTATTDSVGFFIFLGLATLFLL